MSSHYVSLPLRIVAFHAPVIDMRDSFPEPIRDDQHCLSPPLCAQMQMERIRQADCLDRIKVILNDTNLTDINQLPDT